MVKFGKKRVYAKGMTVREYYFMEMEAKMIETMETILMQDPKEELGWKLFKCFAEVDKDGSQEITLEEFYGFYGITETKFVERIFAYFDLDRSRELSFQEFVIGLWNFLTFSTSRMCHFAMKIFDVDEMDTIDKYQCDALVRMVHGVEESPSEFISVISSMATEQNRAGSMHLEEFTAFIEQHPQLLAPAFQLQATLRRRVLGEKFWKLKTDERTTQFGEQIAEDILLRNRKGMLTEKRKMNSVRSKGSRRVNPNQSFAASSILSGSRSAKSRASQASDATSVASLVEDPDEIAAKELVALFTFEQDAQQSDKQQRAITACGVVSKCKREYSQLYSNFREQELLMAVKKGSSSHDDPEFAAQVDAHEAVVQKTAVAKNEFQLAVQELEISGNECLEEGERQAYLRCLKESEKVAEEWFTTTKEGKEYLKVVGKEHALRDSDSNSWFGTVSKSQKEKGEKKAWNEYVAKKARERGEEIASKFEGLREQHKSQVKEFYKEYSLLNSKQEKYLPLWQWQKLEDSTARQFYYYCPAIEASLWSEPFLLNYTGKCEDPSCKDMASVRCVACAREYCANCNMINHAYGAKKNHKMKGDIPQEEKDWREEVRKRVPKSVRQILYKSNCADPIELTRRHLLEREERERMMFQGDSNQLEDLEDGDVEEEDFA